jgi:Putative MetA-pathway of phenol degradation
VAFAAPVRLITIMMFLNRTGMKLTVLAFALGWMTPEGHAQDIEPRRWSHLPTGSNFFGGAYAYTTGDIFLDPVLKIENAEFDLHTVVGKYIRSFELLGKSARVELIQAYQSGEWSGLLNGAPASVERDGWADTHVRFAVNLYGAPPLAGKEFAEYRARTETETIIGAGLGMLLPTGEYLEDKLINLGNNRFNFRPHVGIVHNRGKWSVELTTAAWFFTENDAFFNGNRLEQDPIYAADAHLIYTFRPGLWLSASIGCGFGGASSVNGIPGDNEQRNLGWGLGLGIPINRALGVKVAYIGTRTHADTGLDADLLTCGFSVMW